MASRMKEDEKNEKIIRGLLKLPANRKCINCSSLGPQYVCTNFWTFICTNCSGLHREFTHRVKSISMAKFSSQEVRALQEGGNERARDIYFKEWDPQRHSIPDSSNLDRLRDFIKHVYVERRYTGDRRSTDKPPRVKGEGEESTPYRSASRSPPYEDTFERRYGDRPRSGGRNEDRNFRYSDGERSPGSDPGDYRRSPRRFEVVDDRHRDDRHGIGNPDRRADDRTAADRTPKPEVLSPDSQKGMNASSPPLARSVRDILGDGGAPPRIEPPKSNGTRAPDNATQRQSTSSLTSLGSSNRSSAEFQQASTGSLIDFTTEPEPPVPVVPNQPTNQQTAAGPTDQNWASFDVSAQQKASQITKSVSSLESALADLSTPISAPASNFTTFPGAGVYSLPAVNSGGQFPTTQQQVFSLFPTAGGQATSATSSVPLNGTPNIEGPLAAPTAQSSQATTNPPQQSNTVASQASVNPKISGRKELPEDLFTALYSLAPAPVQAWPVGAQTGIGYGMQYPTAVNAFPHSSKSMNPFDLVNDTNPVHASQFPSMASLRGALPTMNHPSSLTRTGNLEAPAQRWMSTQQPSYPSAFSTSPYMVPQQDQSMQQVHNNMFPMGHQGVGGFGGQGAAFGPLGVDQLSAVRNPLPGTPNAFAPVGGNPFG